MNVQATPTSDLDAMLDAPRQDAAPSESQPEEFAISLAQALQESIEPEVAEETAVERIPIAAHDDENRTNPRRPDSGLEVPSSRANQEQVAIAAASPIPLSTPNPVPVPVTDGEDADEAGSIRAPLAPKAPSNSPNPSRLGRDGTTAQAPVPERPISSPDPAAPLGSAPSSTTTPDTATAASLAPAAAEVRETGNVTQRSVDAVTATPAAAEAAATVKPASKRQDSERQPDLSRRAESSASVPAKIGDPSTSGRDRAQRTRADDAARANDIQQRGERPADPSLDRPVPSAAPPTATASGVPSPITLDLHANATQIAPQSAGPNGPAGPMTETGPAQPITALPDNVGLLASRGGGTARMRLHPGELGDVEITVSIRGESVEVTIRADEPAARAAVLQHREHLAEALGARDLRMDSFDVRGGSREQPADNRQAAWSGSQDRPSQESPRFGTRSRRPQSVGVEDRMSAPRGIYRREGIDLRI